MKYLLTAIKGFSMGASDIVPGVSGGTVALLFGIYEQLLRNVRLGAKALGSLVRLDFTGFKAKFFSIEWSFILPLAAGLASALFILTSIVEKLLKERPEEMAGLFFGLVIASAVVAWGLVTSWKPAEVSMVALVAIVGFILLGFQSGPASDPPLLAYFFAGAVTICAMILPGISGSFLLLMMGMYAAVLGAAHDKEIVPLLIFICGAIVGLAFFSTLLGWLLDKFHDLVLAALIGLMLASLRVLWPWPNGVGFISEDSEEVLSGTGLNLPATAGDAIAPTLLAVVAFVVVVGVTKFANKSAATPAH